MLMVSTWPKTACPLPTQVNRPPGVSHHLPWEEWRQSLGSECRMHRRFFVSLCRTRTKSIFPIVCMSTLTCFDCLLNLIWCQVWCFPQASHWRHQSRTPTSSATQVAQTLPVSTERTSLWLFLWQNSQWRMAQLGKCSRKAGHVS